LNIDPFGGAKSRLLRWGKEAPLRVNPEQAQAFRPGSRRVDTFPGSFYIFFIRSFVSSKKKRRRVYGI